MANSEPTAFARHNNRRPPVEEDDLYRQGWAARQRVLDEGHASEPAPASDGEPQGWSTRPRAVEEPIYASAPMPAPEGAPSAHEVARVRTFIGIQILFLLITPLTGGFHFSAWSMADTALMLQAIGITSLALVVDEPVLRQWIFRGAILAYMTAIGAMGIALMVSGFVGWKNFN